MTRSVLPRCLALLTTAVVFCGSAARADEPPAPLPATPLPHEVRVPLPADSRGITAGQVDGTMPHTVIAPGASGTQSTESTALDPAALSRHAQDANRPSIWRDLFAGTVADARHFPSRQTLGWVVVGAVAAAGTRPADSHVASSLAGARQLDEPLEPGALIGSTPVQLALSAGTYAIGRATGWPRMTAVGADLFRAQLVAQGLTMGIKESVRRQRPEGSGFAFPSGHTTVSFASATVLQQHFGWSVGGPAYALASYVALSRVQMKRHYLSDVAFGAALGIAAGRTITIGRERRVQMSPFATIGGGGVQFAVHRPAARP